MSDPSKIQLGAHIATWRAWRRKKRRAEFDGFVKSGAWFRGLAAHLGPLMDEQRKQPYLLEGFLSRG